ncbi:MAG: SpoIID/LytB domain-containing protein, partial [Planctomycetota bacterium]
GGKLFESYYHSTCGGTTFRGADAFGAPRIAALEPVSCGACTASPYYRWSAAIPVAEVTGALASLCERLPIDLGEVLALEPLERGPGGHAAYLRVVHSRGSFEIDAMRFRDRCSARGYPSLRSTSFAAKRAGGEFRFEGRGWGHGVGMCQMGAKAFAERRANARWILNHYYPSSEVVRLWD